MNESLLLALSARGGRGSGGSSAPSDWNAAEGEPGHILNKPFGETVVGGDTLTWDGSTDGKLIVAEESAQAGCIGTRILAELECRGAAVCARLCNLGSGVVEHGSVELLRNRLGLDAAGIAGIYDALAEHN